MDREPTHEIQLVEAPKTLRIEQALAPPLLDLLKRDAHERRELFRGNRSDHVNAVLTRTKVSSVLTLLTG